ncbi:MAG: 2-hydroxyacyl-CoA dehydratase [Chloroflexi bacterium]|nr:2-hydroxyacyl-CoA dehydratase [Chloroflexota bacterium]
MNKAPGYKRWETRPLECWNKAKELRRNLETSVPKAKEQGKLLADGANAAIISGIANCQPVLSVPSGALIANASPEFSRDCLSAAERRGFGRDSCGYYRAFYGSMLLNRTLSGGEYPRRDFTINTPAACDCHTKQVQQTADHFKIPIFQWDQPQYIGPQNSERDRLMLKHTVAQLLEQIEWLEKVSGRKFDDEKFREAVINHIRHSSYRAEVARLQQNIPAPLDQKSIYSLFALGGVARTQPQETEAFWRMVRDEVKWRVENHIAAVGTERYRWLEDEPPPWYFLKYYRYMEKYGAVCIGSRYSLGTVNWEWREDGTYGPMKNPLELGWPMNTREEILRSQIAAGRMLGRSLRADADLLTQGMLDMAKAFHCDGAIMPLWLAGSGCTYGHREAVLRLAKAGVNVMQYEGSQAGDRTDFDESRMLDQLDDWMESQGLRKLED